jgi:predicted transcriptional regulator
MYNSIMGITKDNAIKAIQELPDDATYEDIMEKLYFMEKVEAGLKDIREGANVSHEEVKKRIHRWLK